MLTLSDALAQSDLFNGLPDSQRAAVIDRMQLQNLQAREILFQQGSDGDSFYVVLRGVLKTVYISTDGSEMVLSLLGPGKSFGEIALLDGGPRSAGIQAISQSVVARLDRQSFQKLLAESAYLNDHIIGTLCKRIRLLTDRVGQLANMDIPTRLANALLGFAEDVGSEMQGRFYLPVRLSQAELAAMIGSSRESVNKFIKLWENEGLIATVDGRLQILSPSSLLDIARSGMSHT